MKKGYENFMREYILKITGAAILAVFVDLLSPNSWRKYLSIVSGIIILSVIISPVAELKNIDILSGYSENKVIEGEGNRIYSDMLEKEFSKRIADDIRERVHEEFSKDVSVETMVEVNEKGNIEKISKIIISGHGLDNKISDRISYIYDVEEVVLNAA